MTSVQTIDVKNLEHAEREKLIFPSLERLGMGQNLKISMEFNPVPLVYLLKAREEFEIAFDKEGPDEWILNVKRIAERKGTKEDLKELLEELKSGDVSAEAKEKAKDFFKTVDAKSIGDLEQELIREGVPHEEVRKSLCDIHLEVMRDSLVEKRFEVEAPHPVHTLMEEHIIIQDNLKELGALVARIKGINSFEAFGEDLEKLKDIAHHLVEAESHHEREEDVLFPVMEKHDIVEPPKIMKLDHVEFRQRKKALYQIAYNHEDYGFADFKQKVIELGSYLAQELDGHIFKEDNILYQMALQTLNPEEWDDIKRECDKIGYCCFTPEDVAEQGSEKDREDVKELDLRLVPPFERHAKIFQVWGSLKSGQTMRIINDHDPKPLRYQFEAEENSKFEWQYEQEGPVDWKVKIKRV